MQPAAEIVGFRIGELRGLSRWRARYQGIGLDEKLIDSATERAGMLLVQVERLIKVLAVVVYQVFLWNTSHLSLVISTYSLELYNDLFVAGILNHVVLVLQFQNFLLWLSKCIKLLMSESSDQLPPFNRFENVSNLLMEPLVDYSA